MEKILELIKGDISGFALKLIGAIAIIVIGFWLAKIIKGFVAKRMQKSEMDESLRSFLVPIIGIILKLLVVIAAVSTVGVEITSLIAVLGGLAIGVGMAMQGSLANFAGGILIILFRPFKVGDYISSQGEEGTVEDINILCTSIITPENKKVILPNASVFNNPIINISEKDCRRVDVKVGISYDDDFEKARVVLLDMLKNEPLLISSEPYTVEILGFGDSSVDLAVRGYARNDDYWNAFFSLNKKTQKVLNENNISIPFPQRDVHIIQQG